MWRESVMTCGTERFSWWPNSKATTRLFNATEQWDPAGAYDQAPCSSGSFWTYNEPKVTAMSVLYPVEREFHRGAEATFPFFSISSEPTDYNREHERPQRAAHVTMSAAFGRGHFMVRDDRTSVIQGWLDRLKAGDESARDRLLASASN
jgi:hypothetical protein